MNKTYIQATCAMCGKRYYKSETNHRKKYCSKKCNWRAQKNGGRVYAKTCAVCGKPFEATRCTKKYCSIECAHEGKLRKLRVYAREKYHKRREAAQAVSVQPAQPRTLMQKIMAFFRRGK